MADVSTPAFWEEVYAQHRDGWEMGVPHPSLVHLVDTTAPPRGRVAVPGCYPTAVQLGLLPLVLPEDEVHAVMAEGEAAMAAALAVAAGACAKIALDVMLLAQTEVGEVGVASPGRSSAMPDKRNLAQAVEARAAFAGVIGQVHVLLAGMSGEHERSAGAWQSEWPAISTDRFCGGA